MKLVMEQRELKSLVESGGYQPQPELVASAMLRRRGVRALLTGMGAGTGTGMGVNPAGRIPSAPEFPRQAA
jgi:hypothetical protein